MERSKYNLSWGRFFGNWFTFAEGIVVYHFLGLAWTLVYVGVWAALGLGVRLGHWSAAQ